ncbi:hypothetical protein MTR67_016590 [Solanum verrucosum]|uniref:RNase H type-1 domain-containing protein n=1 Tax=Solanum verrucosum TaxID=315347 RepID=A0AAF0QL37_SOLVR|nr:hypothetical protein MTR67_016590 [Solanum verrucosum]
MNFDLLPNKSGKREKVTIQIFQLVTLSYLLCHLILRCKGRICRQFLTLCGAYHTCLTNDIILFYSTGEGGLGGVIRNHKGDWVVGFCAKEAHTTPLQAELIALRQGLIMAISNNLVPLDINLDSLEAINMLHAGSSLYNNLIFECRSLMGKLEAAPPAHIFREQNKVADMLSKEGLKCTAFGKPKFLIVPPMYANNAVWNDILGTTFVRGELVFVILLILGNY